MQTHFSVVVLSGPIRRFCRSTTVHPSVALFLALLPLITLFACAPSSERADWQQPVARSDNDGAQRAESESESRASDVAGKQSAEETSESDCLTSADLDDIRREHAANPFRAAETYISERMCLTARIDEFLEGYLIVARVGNDILFGLRPYEHYEGHVIGSGMDVKKRNTWQDWTQMFMEASVGDSIRMDCGIQAISDGEWERSDGSMVPTGVPIPGPCEWVNDRRAAHSRSGSGDTKELTWVYEWRETDRLIFDTSVSLTVPADFDWYDPHGEMEGQDEEYWQAPYSRFVKPTGSNLPLVIIGRKPTWGCKRDG